MLLIFPLYIHRVWHPFIKISRGLTKTWQPLTLLRSKNILFRLTLQSLQTYNKSSVCQGLSVQSGIKNYIFVTPCAYTLLVQKKRHWKEKTSLTKTQFLSVMLASVKDRSNPFRVCYFFRINGSVDPLQGKSLSNILHPLLLSNKTFGSFRRKDQQEGNVCPGTSYTPKRGVRRRC